jgi:hypothetical protein
MGLFILSCACLEEVKPEVKNSELKINPRTPALLR